MSLYNNLTSFIYMKKIIHNRGSIYCDGDLWSIFNSTLKTLNPSKLFILVDTNTREHCLPYFLSHYSLDLSPIILEFKSGESQKNIHTCLNLWEKLSEKGTDRNSLIINLGGGVVTDLGSFVACTIKRGIEFINVPTSLLAMVDASVGGKNGVDLGTIKNQIGTIKNPHSVFIDTSFLKSLPKNEVASGLAEMIKHGLITSEDYWDRVKDFDLKQTKLASELIWESIEIKNSIVTIDPFEKDQRKTLNYGHTLGHAIESFCLSSPKRQEMLHGEAVAIGMILATFISSELTAFPKDKRDKITANILTIFKRQNFNEEEIKSILKYLMFDKKNADGKIYFVLLKNFGEYKINCEVPNNLIYSAFEYYKKF